MSAIWKVGTPTSTTSAGTAAKPFISHPNDPSMDMYVLVAPELYRKVQQCDHIRLGMQQNYLMLSQSKIGHWL